MSAKDFDIVLFGASGFTGRLVAEYLAAHGQGARVALAGRDRAKLERVRAEVGLEAWPILIADSQDAASLDTVVQKTKVVCTTVGPYARYGTLLVERAVEAGIGYCDLTGEVPWMREMIERFHARATATGARIVHACGFDSIPSDLGAFMLVEHMQRVHGQKLSRVRCHVGPLRGGASGGTVASIFEIVKAARDPKTRRVLGDPYSLNPRDAPRGASRNEPLLPRMDPERRRWTAPFVMASANTRVVRRSQALLSDLYGPDFAYEEVLDVGVGAKGFLRASAVSAGLVSFLGTAALPVFRPLYRRILPKPGEGPSAAQRERGHYRMRFFGESAGSPKIHVVGTVAGSRDPGYGETCRLLGESALCLALDPLPARTGVLTPASAMGMALIERLRRAGTTFEVQEDAGREARPSERSTPRLV